MRSGFPTDSWAKRPTRAVCREGHAIIARGQAATGEPGFDPLNVIVSLQNLILKQIPCSTSLGLPYEYGAQNNFVTVHDGALLLQENMTSYVASCPRSKIVVVGYSLVGRDIHHDRKAFCTDQKSRTHVSRWTQSMGHLLLDRFQ